MNKQTSKVMTLTLLEPDLKRQAFKAISLKYTILYKMPIVTNTGKPN